MTFNAQPGRSPQTGRAHFPGRDRGVSVGPLGSRVSPAVFAAVALSLLLPLASTGLIGGVVSVGIIVMLIALFVFDLRVVGTSLVVVAMALAPLNDIRPVQALSFVTASDAAFAVGFILLAPILITHEFRPPPLFMAGAAGIFVVGAIASVLAEEPLLSLNHMVRLMVGAFGLPVLMMIWRPDRPTVLKLAWAYAIGNVVSVVAGVIDGPLGPDNRYVGLTTHPNIFGLCCLLALALFPFLLTSVRAGQRWIPTVVAMISAYGIWISGSRAALLVAIVVAIVYPLLARSIHAALVVFGLGIAAVAFVSRQIEEGAGDNALGRLLGSQSAEGSDQAREEAFTIAWDLFTDRPLLGNGFAHALEAHNIYLQIAAAVGVIGLVAYLVVIWSAVSPVFAAPHPANLLALPAASYAMIAVITSLMWDRFIWSVLSLAFLAVWLDRPDDRDDTTSPPDEQPRHASSPNSRRS